MIMFSRVLGLNSWVKFANCAINFDEIKCWMIESFMMSSGIIFSFADSICMINNRRYVLLVIVPSKVGHFICFAFFSACYHVMLPVGVLRNRLPIAIMSSFVPIVIIILSIRLSVSRLLSVEVEMIDDALLSVFGSL